MENEQRHKKVKLFGFQKELKIIKFVLKILIQNIQLE
jgi:hypothetical protein